MKRYDRAYFDRFYRDPRHRVHAPASVARRARLAVAMAEYVLERPIRSVLDVGAGEGAWRSHVRRLRPAVRYVGVEPSAYAVRRFGSRRGLVQGTVETLELLDLGGPFDLVVCADVLFYVATPALRRGLAAMAALTGGVAWIEAYTTADAVEGDLSGWHPRSTATYRRLFTAAGFAQVGPFCWALRGVAGALAALERGA